MKITREDLLQMSEGMRQIYGEGFRRGKSAERNKMIRQLEDSRMLCSEEEQCDLSVEWDYCFCEKNRELLEGGQV